MKKALILIVTALMIISGTLLFFHVKSSRDAKALEEAMGRDRGTAADKIIHKEKVRDGYIVFSSTGDGKALLASLMKKDKDGYKGLYGVSPDVAGSPEISWAYLPKIENTSPPILFGLIVNPKISQVKIIDSGTGIEVRAKIIESNGVRMWYTYTDKFAGSQNKLDIIGLSADGGELIKLKNRKNPNLEETITLKSLYEQYERERNNISVDYMPNGYSMRIYDKDEIKAMSDYFDKLTFKPAPKKSFDYLTAFMILYVQDGEITKKILVDKNNIFKLNDNNECLEIESGTFDYNYIMDMYQKSYREETGQNK